MPSHRTTGLRPAQFTTLLALLTNTLTWNTPNTKPHKLTLTQGLKATLLYLRQNQTEEFLAEDFGVSQPTISRTLNKIETALLHVLAPAVPPIPETLLQSSGIVIVDGTLVPPITGMVQECAYTAVNTTVLDSTTRLSAL